MSTMPRAIVRYQFGERLVHWRRGAVVRLSAADRPGVLDAGALLDRGRARRRLPVARAASHGSAWSSRRSSLLDVRDLAPRHADHRRRIAQWRRAMAHYIRNEDQRVPAAGRFNYGQKMLFWVMVWGALALLASGVVLWFPEAIPRDCERRAPGGDPGPRGRRARDDRRVHRPPLHGPGRRSRRARTRSCTARSARSGRATTIRSGWTS